MPDSTEKSHILIIDSEPLVRDLLCGVLCEDYSCTIAASAEEGLQLLENEQFSLVLGDLKTGEMNGFEMIPLVRTVAPDSVIVMISSEQNIDSAIHSMRVGAFDYIKKPFNVLHVQTVVEHALEHHSLLVTKRRYENHLEELIEQRKALFEQVTTETDSIRINFKFPEEIKRYCEQYLLYFAQFLHDLGINTNATLTEDAGKILFSITPTNDVEALDKIREALAIYLSLPSNLIPNSTGDRTVDMVLSGARANAKHLESQLELAIAKLQFKEATLELKDATIEQDRLALRQKDETIKELQEIVARGNIFEESFDSVEINSETVYESSLYRFSCEDDIEIKTTPILDEKIEETKIGLVKFHEVTKLKDYGVSLDLPKAIRDLIDYFKRDKNTR